MTQQATSPTQTVRAGINERALFAQLSQWFASSFSVLGELMQNARRAGATSVNFTLDNKNLTISDDGAGIDDFQNLVQFAESGWKTETNIAENPFGMGFFSTLYCAEGVTIRSRGKLLSVSLTDVLDRRQLHVTDDPDPVLAGTVVTLQTLADKFLGAATAFNHSGELEHLSKLQHELTLRAMGFPIPVTFNGVDLPRPHAQSCLAGEHTEVGFWSVAGVHREQCDVLPERDLPTSYYLQGLPVGYNTLPTASQHANVLHLNGSAFVALLPDRQRLKDEQEAKQRIAASLYRLMRRVMVSDKSQLPDRQFVDKWFNYAVRNGHAEVFNDVPLLPQSAFSCVESVAYSSSETWRMCRGEGQYMHAKDIATGKEQVWLNAPSSTTESPQAAAILKIMEREQVLDIHAKLHPDHWIHRMASNCLDLFIRVTPGEVIGRGWLNDVGATNNCEVVLVKDFTVALTSRTDMNFRREFVIDNDWLILPTGTEGVDWEVDDGDMHLENICYLTPGVYPGPIVDVFSDFTDEFESYMEEWRDAAGDRVAALVRGLQGLPFSATVQDALSARHAMAQDRQLDALVVVRPVRRWDRFKGAPGANLLVADDLSVTVWQEVAQRLQGVTAEQLRDAFVAVVRPGELTNIGDENAELLIAAGYNVSRGAAPLSWVAVLPGHKEPDFESEDHNYSGPFSSLEDLYKEIVPGLCERAAAHHGLNVQAFMALGFEDRYNMVRAANPTPTV